MIDKQNPCLPRAKRKLIDGMLALLAERKFDDITIDDICQSAGLSRTTFYRYFEDKYDLTIQYFESFVAPPDEVYTNEDARAYFDRLFTMLYLLQNSSNPIKSLLHYDGNKELQWRIYTRPVAIFTEYYQTLLKCEPSSAVPKMLAVSICTSLIGLIAWVVENDFPVPKTTLIDYFVHISEQNLLFFSL